jgi:hypothetical protein
MRIRHDRPSYEEAVAECGVLRALAPFDPRIAGTPPPGLDLPGSDIDVLCFAPDAHAIPVEQQRGWRHFVVERRLLALGGEDLQEAVLAQRRRGMKTEPAFAAALGLNDDPYLALLDLGEQDDETLVSVLRVAGFGGATAP